MSDSFYSELESRLRKLHWAACALISPQNADEIDDLIDHSEYGVALTWLASSLDENNADVPAHVRTTIGELADLMEIANEIPEGFRS